MRRVVTPTKGMGYSDIYLDFLTGKSEARHFYPTRSVYDAAATLDSQSFRRREIAAILKRQNEAYGASDETRRNIDLLAEDERTLCVFSGQQAVLLGGPMLVMLKALGIVKAAKLYAKQLRRPVIPVFWIAADDHDFEEVNHTTLLTRQTEPVTVSYGSAPAKEVPVSEVYFSDGAELDRLKAEVRDILGQTDFTDGLYDLIDRAYTGEDSFATAFGKFMAALTRDTGLILFSPGDPQVKRLARPFYRAIVEQQDELHERLSATNQEIVDAGYHLQVEKADDSAHLFCNCDGRRPVKRIDGRFVVGDYTVTRDELLQKIEDEPEKFSTDVMTRPVLQSWLFPVLSQKGGPAEIAYLAQCNRLFELFARTPPFYLARPSVTVVEARIARLVHDYHIMFRELTGDIELVVNRVLAHTFPANIEKSIALLRQDIEFHMEKFTGETLKFDPSLKKFSDQTYGKIDYLLNGFQNKVFASHKKKSDDTRQRIYRVHNALHTNRGLQERSLNLCHFVSRYGLDFVSYLYREVDSEEQHHQILDMTDYETS